MSQPAPHTAVKVTLDNFARAESDMYFANFVRDAGSIGKLSHNRQPAPIDRQSVVRLNRDTLYSFGTFDLDAGPVTIILPDTGGRFMSLMAINEDHYIIDTAHKSGRYTYSREQAGTRYLSLGVRTLANANDPADIKATNALQDQIRIEQAATGTWETPDWDPVSQKKVRDTLAPLGPLMGDSMHSFGPKSDVDPVEHLVATAIGWGGTPAKDAHYIMGVAENNDGNTPYQITVKDVPVDGFWSVTVYNRDGYLEKNPQDIYSFNNLTAKPNPDGSVTIHFGGDPARTTNSIPIFDGWNYAVRLYLPRPEILNGDWVFPDATPVH